MRLNPLLSRQDYYNQPDKIALFLSLSILNSNSLSNGFTNYSGTKSNITKPNIFFTFFWLRFKATLSELFNFSELDYLHNRQ
jgi:hypothetical protein